MEMGVSFLLDQSLMRLLTRLVSRRHLKQASSAGDAEEKECGPVYSTQTET